MGDCNVCFNIWDIAGQEKFSGLRKGYFIQADAAIVMVDVTRPTLSVSRYQEHVDEVKKECGDIPIVIVFNKVDCEHRDLPAVPYPSFNISSKDATGLELPLRHLADILTSSIPKCQSRLLDTSSIS